MERSEIESGGRRREWAPAGVGHATLTAAVVLLLGVLTSGCAQQRMAGCCDPGPCGVSCCCGGGFGPHVEIFRGLGGHLPGSEELQGRLAAYGISSTVSHGNHAHRVAAQILERRRAGDRCPIVLMGYATGGGGTAVVAEVLREHGICVDAVILLEPSFFEPVRSNVRYIFVALKPEPLQQWNPIMRGEPVRVESCATRVQFVNLEEIDPCDRLDEVNHLTIPADPWVQQVLVGQAVCAFRRSCCCASCRE